MTPAWGYGPEGAAFPVAVGEVWAAGHDLHRPDHLLACSDLLTSGLLAETVASAAGPAPGAPTLVYTDPPWGQALLQGFRTKAGLAPATYEWILLYRKVATLAAGWACPVYAECSVITSRDGARVPAALTPAGPVAAYWPITYYRTKPAGLFYAGPVPPPVGLLADGGAPSRLDGLDDDRTPGVVLAAHGADGARSGAPTSATPAPLLVVDPCAGRGLTSRAAHHAGWRSVSNELAPARVSAALARLARLGLEVGRVHGPTRPAGA